MNKSSVVDRVAERLNVDRREARAVVDALIATVEQAVAAGEKVVISGFLSFEPVRLPPRTVRNPRTGVRIARDAIVRVRVRVGEPFQHLVRRSARVGEPSSRTGGTRPVPPADTG